MFYKEFSMDFFIKLFLKYLKMLVLLTVLGAIVCVLYANFLVTPQYQASAMILVQNFTAEDAAEEAEAYAESVANAQGETVNKSQVEDNKQATKNGNVKIYASDLNASATLADYCSILFRNTVEIQEMLNGCSMSLELEDESNFMWVRMTSSDPQNAADTCNAVVEKIPELFDQTFAAGGVTIIKHATTPTAGVYPNIKNYGLYGAIGGLAIAIIIAFIREIIDTTVKNDDDLLKIYKIPVFGEILDFDQKGAEGKKYEDKNTYYQQS